MKKKKCDFLITTTTLSSSKLFLREFNNKENIKHRFFPIDKLKLVKEFLSCWSPNLIIFVDSEIWPNFLLEINKNKIPLVLLNARITKKTFSRWIIISKIAKKIFQTFDLCLASSNESKKYLENLNVKNVKYIGNLKLASNNTLENLSSNNEDLPGSKKFWCCMSIHEGEDIFCLETHIKIKKVHQEVTTIIIPRHIERVKNIESLCQKLNLKSQILSEDGLISLDKEIIIINSYGIASKYLKFCKSVFIGKSTIKKLESVGGQNPIEAAKFGCKIYHGPYVYNFQEVYELLNKNNISEKIYSVTELSNKLIYDLNNRDKVGKNNITILNEMGKRILDKTYNEIGNIF